MGKKNIFTHQQKERTNIRPTEPPVQARPVSQHTLDVRGESVHPINPTDAGRLYKDDE